jgi:hypothetical protein
MIGASTDIACIGLAARMREAVLDALSHYFRHKRMQAEGGGDEKLHARVMARGVGCESRNVLVPMPAREQKVGKHDNSPRPARDASRKRGVDRRLGQLHVGGLDDRYTGCFSELPHDVQQQLIARVAPGAVIDNNHADFLNWIGH